MVRSAILGLCLATFVTGQDVLPASLVGIEGGSASSIPFGVSGPVRYQMIYDADQLPFSGPRLITEIRIRPDWNGGAAFPAKQFLRVDVDISTTSRGSDNASTVFDENHGVDRTRVLTFHQLALPAQPDMAGAPGPRPATISIPFIRPFWYGMSPLRPNGEVDENLCIDLMIVSQPSGFYRVDSPFTCDSQVTPFGQVADPCRPSHLTDAFLEIDSSSDIRAGGSVTWTVSNVAPSGPFWVAVAPTATGDWLGMPLPAGRIRVSQLDPADSSLAFIGEDRIDHTPRNEDVLIEMGNAFDVVGERKQTDFRLDLSTRNLWETFEIRLRNQKDEPVEVVVLENLYRYANWRIEDSSHRHRKTQSDRIRFELDVPSEGEVVLTYTAHYHW